MQYPKSIFSGRRGQIFSSLLFTLLLLLTVSACNLPGSEPEDDGGAEFSDPDAELYRMFFDDENGEVQVREFVGQLRMTDYETIFNGVNEMEEDESGNAVGGPLYKYGRIWAVKESPSKNSVNLISISPDGTTSSAMDLTGNGVADIVDMLLPDGRRFTFLTEALGMGMLEDFMLGLNPWCNDELVIDLGIETNFGCDRESSSDGGGSSGGGPGGISGGGFVDPMDIICSGFDTSPRARLFGAAPTYGLFFTFSDTSIFRGDEGSTRIVTAVHTTDSLPLEHVRTTRIIYHYDGDDQLIQRIDESVDAEGDGTRTIRNYENGRETDVVLPAPFKAKMSESELGQYNSDKTDPPAPSPHTVDSEESRDESREFFPDTDSTSPDAGTRGNPGPEGDDSSVAAFCTRRGEVRGGVEEAAATNPAAMGVSCGDLVGAPSGGDDCIIIDWAGAGDFVGATEPSGNDCGPFEQPDEDGNCSGTSIASRLRGMTAAVASANLAGFDLCGGLVCRGPDSLAAATGARQEVSGTLEEAPEVNGEAGTIPAVTLCYFGPGADYGTVSSLAEGIEVEIVGVGSADGWWIILNPNFDDVTCWIEEDNVELPPDFSPDGLPEFDFSSIGDDGGDDGGSGAPPDSEGPEDCADDEYWSTELESCEPFG